MFGASCWQKKTAEFGHINNWFYVLILIVEVRQLVATEGCLELAEQAIYDSSIVS